MMHSPYIKIGILLGVVVVLGMMFYLAPTYVLSLSYSRSDTALKPAPNSAAQIPLNAAPVPPPVTHIKTPDVVKAIYMTACVAGTPSLRTGLVKIADTTEVNSIIIDVKDFSGGISFVSRDPDLVPYISTRCKANDMQAFINDLHEKNIYVIGRVTAFQDPLYVKLQPETAIKSKSTDGPWKDKNGLTYIDPSSKSAWTHLESIALAAHDIGFDEINFDYIRYPSDGNVADIKLPGDATISKEAVLKSFFEDLNDKMVKAGIIHSADFFGMTTTNTDDLGIGQVLEDGLRNFDFVDPMVYPSHYPENWNNFSLPDKYPYEVINISMKKAAERATAIGENPLKLRPWLQDFELHHVPYTADMIEKEKQATYDAGLTSWLMWNASNVYNKVALSSAS